MAHIIDLRFDCAKCGGLATHEVVNSRNSPVGKYCWRDAQKRLKEIEAIETATVQRIAEANRG